MQDDAIANKSLLALREVFGETVTESSFYVCHISSLNFACQHATEIKICHFDCFSRSESTVVFQYVKLACT
jgi:hypothetical protein